MQTSSDSLNSQPLLLTAENSKLLGSKRWRLENLYTIKDKEGTFVKFKLNPAQLHYYYKRHNNNLIAKARQLGFTTFHVIDYLDDCIFNASSIDSAVIADTLPNVRKIFGKAKTAYEQFPLKHMLVANTETKNELVFPNGGSMSVTVDARSGTFQRLHVSELGKIDRKFPEKSLDIMTGALPTVSNGIRSIESTGDGDSGNFYDMCQTARKIWASGRPLHPSDWKLFFYPWTIDPNYVITDEIPLESEASEYMQKNNLTLPQARFWQSKRKDHGKYIYQEYPTVLDECFIGGAGRYFDVEALNARIKFVRKPLKVGPDWIMWKEPVAGHFYIIGCDVAEGYGGDSSSIEVVDMATGEQVYEFCANSIKVDAFAKLIYQVGRMYNWALVGVERNNHGLAVLMFLHKGVNTENGVKVYPNIYRQKTVDKTTNKPVFKLGWWTGGVSKPLMLDELEFAISGDEESLRINSVPCLLEMRDFTTDNLNVTLTAKKVTSRHFDRLMGLAICWQMRKEPIRSTATRSELGL